jgi:uncharacterized protein with GYD domain
MPRYIGLMEFRKKPTQETIRQNLEMVEKDKSMGVTVHEIYWTLGRYDAVVIVDAPDEKALLRGLIARSENVHSETMVAIPLDEARKLVP